MKLVGVFYINSNKPTNQCLRFLFVQLSLPWTGAPRVRRGKMGELGQLNIACH